MITPQEIEQKIRLIKPKLEQDFGIDKIGYFGSFVNGNFSDESDIDILVIFSRRVGWKFFDLKDYLESILKRKIDLVTEGSIKKRWRKSIMKQVKYI